MRKTNLKNGPKFVGEVLVMLALALVIGFLEIRFAMWVFPKIRYTYGLVCLGALALVYVFLMGYIIVTSVKEHIDFKDIAELAIKMTLVVIAVIAIILGVAQAISVIFGIDFASALSVVFYK